MDQITNELTDERPNSIESNDIDINVYTSLYICI